ncbi:NAD(P)-dependent alcohol dehydrogenase [Stygiolobus caldivivus]|uniref:Alcohol dehydrogenase n=1 Tax=Stygiolobus caldivivus TaxID=2824673 RepID=A0A8D5UAB7_9CREN|nr:NAD(P)-dependent alcohol dehydrogenase [Stygiolobus caldivivus]BCU71544.1 alcohol dehydrogenase [Stygiolobus caldivivus]
MKSRAALLREIRKPLSIENIEVKEPKGEEVLVRVEGAGLCRTDLRIWKGLEARPSFRLPIVLGHENAGRVVQIGDKVNGIRVGDRVVVYATWGDLSCRYCREGKFSLCKNQVIPGQTTNGGFSEYLLVPSYRWLVKTSELNPLDAAPLADAGTTSMGAVRKALPFVYKFPLPIIIVNGIGGLAVYVIQILKALVNNAIIVGISRSERHRDLAVKLGADYAVTPNEAEKIVNKLSEGLGASVAIDLVGTEESTHRLGKMLAQEGGIIEVGLEGKNISLDTFDLVVWNKQLLGSNYGTLNDLEDVTRLAEMGKIKSVIVKRKLDEINEALKDLEAGNVEGREVIVP